MQLDTLMTRYLKIAQFPKFPPFTVSPHNPIRVQRQSLSCSEARMALLRYGGSKWLTQIPGPVTEWSQPRPALYGSWTDVTAISGSVVALWTALSGWNVSATNCPPTPSGQVSWRNAFVAGWVCRVWCSHGIISISTSFVRVYLLLRGGKVMAYKIPKSSNPNVSRAF